MTSRILAPVGALALLVLSTNTPLVAGPQAPVAESGTDRHAPQFRALKPGKFVVHKQRVPVDIVLIGFDAGQVNAADLSSWLPETYTPLVRYPEFYGLHGRDLGLEYTFSYSILRKSRTFENRFFSYLRSAGRPGAPTPYQAAYNAQASNVLDVAGPVLYIDAASVERWLERNAQPRTAGYTVYFVNWHGRNDFRFHVYTKTDDPDPDTGFNFGGLARNAITSWGGTSSRTWFYDFSAGPEWNTTNWVVDVKDLDEDGTEDYRMPPIWEYASNGYRSADLLGSDMGLLTRFVAIDLLFTTSPLYDPLVTAPQPLGRKIADITMFEDGGDPANKGIDFVDTRFAETRWRELQPYYRWKSAVRAVDPIDPGAKQALDIFTENSDAADCWTAFGTPFAQLFCYFRDNLAAYVPHYGERDYVAPTFAFNTTAAGLGSQLGLLGFADDNWEDGTQSFVFAFGAAIYRNAGYGFTATIIHEVGHHVGMSHPHDGYDSEFGFDFGPGGDLYFAWEGDESDTVMQYLSVTNRFGTHNQDNMYRWELAGYLNRANALAGAILASDRAHRVRGALLAADALAGLAESRFDDWQYLEAVQLSLAAYGILNEAAREIGVSSPSLAAARTRLPEALVHKYVCRPRALIERISAPRN